MRSLYSLQVVESPEILSVIHAIPHLSSFLNSLYSCKYGEFMQVGGCARARACVGVCVGLGGRGGVENWS